MRILSPCSICSLLAFVLISLTVIPGVSSIKIFASPSSPIASEILSKSVSESLKNLARELKIPVIAVSQLSRAVEHRGERKPQLADLRESGAIEQDADVVMFLYREADEYMPTMPVKLLIAKHRNGPTGEIDLLFRGDRIKFYNIEKAHREEGPAQREV